MAIPLIPWEPHVFDPAIQAELRRRQINRGMNFVDNNTAVWSKDDDSWNNYRGPMTAWVRVCSNGRGLESMNPPKYGFVFYGGKDFYTGYGFNQGGNNYGPNNQIIGYTPDGVPHIVENDLTDAYPIHVPTPEIERINAVIQKELLRQVSIEWTCFSSKQLEYMTPYFFIPGITMVIEWGWNHFNPLSLLDLTDTDNLKALYNNPYSLYTQNVLDSRGNYEVVFGMVTNFEWSIEGNKIRCRTEVTSKDRIWAGQVVTMKMVEQDQAESNEVGDGNQPNVKVFDDLKRFIDDYIDSFKDFVDNSTNDPEAVIRKVMAPATKNTGPNTGLTDPLKGFIDHVKTFHPNNYVDYLLGAFYGRDEQVKTSQIQQAGFGGQTVTTNIVTSKGFGPGADKEHDFDCQSPRTTLWLNMGMIIEMVNYFCAQLKGFKNQPLFRVDVDDCVIGAHPNLISTDGDILLIPNALAPKFHSGTYGLQEAKDSADYRKNLALASKVTTPQPTKAQVEANAANNVSTPKLIPADYRLRQILWPLDNAIYRDDLNAIINANRFKHPNPKATAPPFEFPFSQDFIDNSDGTPRKYQGLYTGFFKNLYLNIKTFREILDHPGVITYKHVVEQIFTYINSAASDFWQLSLQGSTGRQSTGELATMKIVDDKLTQYTSNGDNTIFTFDYNTADNLFHTINFRPMLSNAQAIRTIYAQTTNANSPKKVVISDKNELLDYGQFKDRLLFSDDQSANKPKVSGFISDSFIHSMATVQSIVPSDKKFFQMTMNLPDGRPNIYRLAIPDAYADILTLILDDNDKTFNPRYTGIMPGIQAEFTIQGIAGLRTFAMFRVRGLPNPYSEENIVFRIVNIKDSIQNGNWQTTITAGVIPLRGYFRSKLGLPVKSQVKGQ